MGRLGILLLIRGVDPELGMYRDAEVRDGEGSPPVCDGDYCSD